MYSNSKIEPSVGIVILNWNRKADTVECIRSIQKINYSKYKIILIDNASTDDSCLVIETEFKDIVLIKNKENVGFPVGNNQGIEWAIKNNLDYILLLNNDTIVAANFLDKLLEIALNYNDVGILGCRIVYHSKPNIFWSVGGFIDKRTGRPYHFQKDIFQTNDSDFCCVDWVSGCALLIRSSVVKQIGFLDTNYFFGMEDVDWCTKATKSGWNIAVVRNSVVKHKKQEFKLVETYSSLQHYYTLRNLLIFVKKHIGFNLPFIISFCITFFQRIAWSILTLDFKSLKAIILAVYDFKQKKFGKTNYGF